MTFSKSYNKGEVAVMKFCKFLNNNGFKNKEATMDEQYQGIDVKTDAYSYEVKHMSFEDAIVIEENSMNGEGSGWIYTSTSDWLIEVRDDKFLKISMPSLRNWYLNNKSRYLLRSNKPTIGLRGDVWTSQFRIVPIIDLKRDLEIKEYKI